MRREKTFHKSKKRWQGVHCVSIPTGEPSRAIYPGDVEINKKTEPNCRAECQWARACHIYEQFSIQIQLFRMSILEILPREFSQSWARVWSPELVNYQENEIYCWKNNQAIGSFTKITTISKNVYKFYSGNIGSSNRAIMTYFLYGFGCGVYSFTNDVYFKALIYARRTLNLKSVRIIRPNIRF